MGTFLIIVVILAAGFALWKFRVPILAKILGQPKSRIERQLNRRRD